MSKGGRILISVTCVILLLFFLFSGLAKAQAFLAPLVTAVILALVVLPFSRKLEERSVKRGYTSLLTTLLLFLISLGFIALISFQVESFVAKWPVIKEAMRPKIEDLQSFVFKHTPLDKRDLPKSGGNYWEASSLGSGRAFTFFSSTFGFIGSFLLTLIYVFFLLNYRSRFQMFILKLFPENIDSEVKSVLGKSAEVVQQYLIGKLILMGLLAVVYSIGLGLSGVSDFILIGVIAALLTLIPYIGNIIGMALAMAFGYLTSGDLGVLIGVLVTFTLAQFTESYVLQPYVVGDKVDLHPFFVIVAVVIGNALWGIIGMILAIPIMAVLAITFLHIPPLHPFGILFSKKSE